MQTQERCLASRIDKEHLQDLAQPPASCVPVQSTKSSRIPPGQMVLAVGASEGVGAAAVSPHLSRARHWERAACREMAATGAHHTLWHSRSFPSSVALGRPELSAQPPSWRRASQRHPPAKAVLEACRHCWSLRAGHRRSARGNC